MIKLKKASYIFPSNIQKILYKSGNWFLLVTNMDIIYLKQLCKWRTYFRIWLSCWAIFFIPKYEE